MSEFQVSVLLSENQASTMAIVEIPPRASMDGVIQILFDPGNVFDITEPPLGSDFEQRCIQGFFNPNE